MEEFILVLKLLKVILVDTGMIYVIIGTGILFGIMYYFILKKEDEKEEKRYSTKYGKMLDEIRKDGFYK